MQQYLAAYAYSSASAEQLVEALVAALLEGAAKQPANADQKPLCAPACLLPEEDALSSGSNAGLGSAFAGLASTAATSELVTAAADLINPLLYSAGYAEVGPAVSLNLAAPCRLSALQRGCLSSAL